MEAVVLDSSDFSLVYCLFIAGGTCDDRKVIKERKGPFECLHWMTLDVFAEF